MSMINLIPPHTRSEIMYARRNKMLRSWLFAMLIGIAGILTVVLVGTFQIDLKARQLEQDVTAAREELKVQKLEETSEQVEEMSNSFKLVTQVLSKQVLFSEVLKQVGAVMPDGASLTSLSIEELNGGIDLQVSATNYQTASQVQVNLEDPSNKLFEKVDIVNISCESAGAVNAYPCTGTYRALYSNNNPFFFLNTKGSGQ